VEYQLLEFYRSEFQRLWILPQRLEGEPKSPHPGIEQARHAAWMVEEMFNYANGTKAEHYDEAKVNRWIGFIQGVLWMYGVYRVNDLREHVIRAKEGKLFSSKS